MKNIKVLVMLLVLAMAGCSHLPKEENAKKSFQFARGKMAIEIEALLPASYNLSKNADYPVIFVLDGYWNKASVLEAYNALRFDNMVPEAIIVTIGYPPTVQDYETQRMWDLTPVYDAGFKAGGNGAELLDILTQEVVPFVQKNFKTDKSRSVLIGHSLAGLFTLYALYEGTDTFSHYAAISPSALWSDHALSKIDERFSAKSGALKANLYITYETDEYLPYVIAIENYIDQLNNRHYEGLALTIAQVQEMGHVSMKAEGYMRGLAWSFADIRPEGPSEFEKKNLRALENLKINSD